MRAAVVILAFATVLIGCSRAETPRAPPRNDDPAITAALNAPLLTDPDLATLNQAYAVASLPSADTAVPSLDVTPDAIARARSDAEVLVGGTSQLLRAPPATGADHRVGAVAQPGAIECARRATYSAIWAARLPPTFPIYPRGALERGAGIDDGPCHLRAVTFRTPVSPREVIDFYFTLSRGAGFSAEHRADSNGSVLGGDKGARAYTVRARPLAGGITEVELVTSG